MKPPKKYYPLVAATVLIAGGLIPVSFGGEKIQVQSTELVQAESDAVKKRIQVEIMQPLAQLADRRSRFSRIRPIHSTSYQLVEATAEESQAERTFTIIRTQTPYRAKAKESKPQSSDYLKLRHLAKTDQIQVKLKEAWVSLHEHPILSSLPKPKPTEPITP